MLLTAVRDEFSFHCQCRKLSPRTIKNYTKQIDYLIRYLVQEYDITHIEDPFLYVSASTSLYSLPIDVLRMT